VLDSPGGFDLQVVVVVGAPEVGDWTIVVVPEVHGTARADITDIVGVFLRLVVPIQLSRLQRAAGPCVPPVDGVCREVVVFPAPQHIRAHWVQVVTVVLVPVVVVVTGREGVGGVVPRGHTISGLTDSAFDDVVLVQLVHVVLGLGVHV